MQLAIQGFVLLAMLARASAECYNGCSGNGACTSSDSCACSKGYGGNDCSIRLCPVGYAHVDSPRGDLDGDNVVTNADKTVVVNSPSSPYGLVESGPEGLDTDLRVVTEAAHEYMVCSNKGMCDEVTGTCTCLPGYSGHACQRADCPNGCSGKGVCQSISQIANLQGGKYKLWDKESTYGCVCDAGYYGPDCSMRKCKVGTDALYFDDYTTQKFPTFYLFMITTRNTGYPTPTTDKYFVDGTVEEQDASWRITFYDSFDEDYTTERLADDATCTQIQDALYRLPGNVVPDGSVECSKYLIDDHPMANATTWKTTWTDVTYKNDASIYGHLRTNNISLMSSEIWASNYAFGAFNTRSADMINEGRDFSKLVVRGYAYQLRFNINGEMKEPKIELYTDGSIPTLVSHNNDTDLQLNDESRQGSVITAVFTNGEQGEDYDYFADHCDGVTVTIDYANFKLTPSDATLLKRCLADSDNDWNDQSTIDNYDLGDDNNPHLIKLVKTSTASNDGGFYVPIKIDGSGDFKMMIPFQGREWDATGDKGVYEVFTTKGTLERVSTEVDTVFNVGGNELFTVNYEFEERTDHGGSGFNDRWSGDLSCEVTQQNSQKYADKDNYGIRDHTNNDGVSNCLNVGDKIVLLGPNMVQANADFMNIYTVESLNTLSPIDAVINDSGNNIPSALATHRIGVTPAINFGHVSPDATPTNAALSVRRTQYAIQVYKFTPHEDSTYHVVAECSNRGICDTATGLCNCFEGYTGDSCQQQSILSC